MSDVQSSGGTERHESRRAELTRIIDEQAIRIVFQPILDLRSGAVRGYEALTRLAPSADGSFARIDDLFDVAESLELSLELEALVRQRSIESAIAQNWDDCTLLFLNCSPRAIAAERHLIAIRDILLESDAIEAHRIVLEITERTKDDVMDDLGEATQGLRDSGFQIAIDDVGIGTSGLKRILSLRPSWIKIDRALIAQIDDDPFKQNLIRFFVRFVRLGEMNLIAEGIERTEELNALIELGVTHGQGFCLGAPLERPKPIDAGITRHITLQWQEADAHRFKEATNLRIETLASPVVSCDRNASVEEARRRLDFHRHRTGVVVLDGRRYLGWLPREKLIAATADFPLGMLSIEDSPLMGADITLAEALEIVASRDSVQVSAPLVVGHHGRIIGIIMLQRLLIAAAKSQQRLPSRCAPLTGLPDRVQADRWISSHIRRGESIDIAFVDVRDFDAYNSSYGFELGDAMLRRLVGLMQATLLETEPMCPFAAHLGEDRFIIACPPDSVDRLRAMGESFNAQRGEFFSSTELGAGAFRYVDPTGSERALPLSSLRIVYLPQALHRVADPRELYDLARQLRMRSRDLETPGETSLLLDERDVGSSRQAAA